MLLLAVVVATAVACARTTLRRDRPEGAGAAAAGAAFTLSLLESKTARRTQLQRAALGEHAVAQPTLVVTGVRVEEARGRRLGRLELAASIEAVRVAVVVW